MTSAQIREKFLKFFEKKGHKIIPSSSLIPENDPTALFINSGMHPLVPYLLGEPYPLGKRLCDVQKCLRTDDIEEVGDETHLTFFEMLGNWSLGDYFKKEAIEWSCEFLTKELGIPLEKLAVSVFEGEKGIPCDKESAEIWQRLGMSKRRIVYLGRKDNWWGPAGETGPCGPDTEMFYWSGSKPTPENFDPKEKQWVEIWNDVFMQYNRQIKNQKSKIKMINQNVKIGEQEKEKKEYEFVALGQKNVDTGMGLERVTAILQGKSNVYETELFIPILEEIKKHITLANENEKWKIEWPRASRIIADHIKAATFILAEKLVPSNIERGYVLRRLIRRGVRRGKLLGIEKPFIGAISKVIIKIYKDIYPELAVNQNFIFDELTKEEEKFNRKLVDGIRILSKMFKTITGMEHDDIRLPSCCASTLKAKIDGKELFHIYETYGLPIEMAQEIMSEWGVAFDEQTMQEAKEAFKRHQELSRTAAKGKFKSGLADYSEKTIKYHTATHLLHAALRKILGKSVKQMGSNITSERLRFDFAYHQKLNPEQLAAVERLVNQKIREGLEVKVEEMSAQKALKEGALAFFRERYPDKVKVFTISDSATGEIFSKEICSGPHIENTSELGEFKIIKEEASGQGVRRLRAILK